MTADNSSEGSRALRSARTARIGCMISAIWSESVRRLPTTREPVRAATPAAVSGHCFQSALRERRGELLLIFHRSPQGAQQKCQRVPSRISGICPELAATPSPPPHGQPIALAERKPMCALLRTPDALGEKHLSGPCSALCRFPCRDTACFPAIGRPPDMGGVQQPKSR